MLRAAIVGCGKIADGHVEEIQKLAPNTEVVAVCDRELVMARQLAVRYGIQGVYDDYASMLAQTKPDVVHIATPPHVHRALACQAMDAGAHVFVEKPLTLNYADSKALIDHAEKTGRKVSIGYSYHYEPPAQELRQLRADGQLGDVVHVESFYGYNMEGAFGKALLSDPNHWVHAMPGKLLQNTLDHALAKIIEFLPDERPQVTAFGSSRRDVRFGDVRDELVDEARVIIRGEKVTAYITFSGYARPVGHFLRVYGTKNTAHLDFNNRTCTLDLAPTLPSAIGRLVPAFEQAAQYAREGARNMARFSRSGFHFFAGLGELFRLFYASIENNTPPPISSRDILRVAWMLDEIFAQVRDSSRASASTTEVKS